MNHRSERSEDKTWISSDTLLLALLMLPNLWFNQFASALAMTALGMYGLTDVWGCTRERQDLVFSIKFVLIFVIVGSISLVPALYYMGQRLPGQPDIELHDGAFQTEWALRFLQSGKNPYVESYVGTGLESYVLTDTPQNPALHNFVYFPSILLISLPFYVIASTAYGWYDQRLVYVLAYILVLFLVPHLTAHPVKKLLLVMSVGLNFYSVEFVRSGRNDILIFLFVLLAILFLRAQKWNAAAVCLGLACATKPSAWFLLPFLSVFLTQSVEWRTYVDLWLKKMSWFWLVLIVTALPFLLWDIWAFWRSTVAYVLGLGGTAAYPIRGYGLGALFLTFGVIPSPLAQFPFIIFQVVAVCPVLCIALYAQFRKNTIGRALASGAITFLVFMFFSRFFQDNYFHFGLLVIIMAWLIDPFLSRDHLAQQADAS